jgi:formylglycine-generating enzyme required for sulfatase activity
MLKRACYLSVTGLLWVLLGLLLNGAAHAQEAEVARKKCVDFGFQPNTNQHAECVKQFLQSSGVTKPPEKAAKATGQPTNSIQLEEKFWDAAMVIGNRAAFEGYLQTYPKGRYVALARAGLERLSESGATQQQAATEAMQKLLTERAAFEAEQRVARDRAAGDAAEKTAAAEATTRASAMLQAANEAMRKLATERTAFEAAQNVASAAAAKREATNPRLGQIIKDCADCPELVVIPAGSFEMGSAVGADEYPIHRLNVPSFLIGKTEVTQRQWRTMMGSNPSRFSQCGDECPVDSVNWNDAQEFARRLSQKTGKSYRLPSEAEWEYAARAGSQTKWSFGDSEWQLGEFGWYAGNSQNQSQRVAQKYSNAYGLFDIHGNVWEWVEDCWHANYIGAPTNGSAWTTACNGNVRVLRGGSWDMNPAIMRSAYRGRSTTGNRISDYGLRIARNP